MWSPRYRFLLLFLYCVIYSDLARALAQILSATGWRGAQDSSDTQSDGRAEYRHSHAIVNFCSSSTMRITFAGFRNRHCPAGRKCRGRIRFPRASFPYVGADQRFRDGNRKNITKLHVRTWWILRSAAEPIRSRASLEREAHGTSDGIDSTYASSLYFTCMWNSNMIFHRRHLDNEKYTYDISKTSFHHLCNNFIKRNDDVASGMMFIRL